jgi:hypothetical protein
VSCASESFPSAVFDDDDDDILMHTSVNANSDVDADNVDFQAFVPSSVDGVDNHDLTQTQLETEKEEDDDSDNDDAQMQSSDSSTPSRNINTAGQTPPSSSPGTSAYARLNVLRSRDENVALRDLIDTLSSSKSRRKRHSGSNGMNAPTNIDSGLSADIGSGSRSNVDRSASLSARYGGNAHDKANVYKANVYKENVSGPGSSRRDFNQRALRLQDTMRKDSMISELLSRRKAERKAAAAASVNNIGAGTTSDDLMSTQVNKERCSTVQRYSKNGANPWDDDEIDAHVNHQGLQGAVYDHHQCADDENKSSYLDETLQVAKFMDGNHTDTMNKYHLHQESLFENSVQGNEQNAVADEEEIEPDEQDDRDDEEEDDEEDDEEDNEEDNEDDETEDTDSDDDELFETVQQYMKRIPDGSFSSKMKSDSLENKSDSSLESDLSTSASVANRGTEEEQSRKIRKALLNCLLTLTPDQIAQLADSERKERNLGVRKLMKTNANH